MTEQHQHSETSLKSVILINLDQDRHRLVLMTQQFVHLRMTFIRHRALNGAEAITAYPNRFTNCKLSAGEIGCFGSHLEIADKISRGDYAAPALVVEDDLELPDTMRELVTQILKRAPQDWEMIRLSNTPRRGLKHLAQFQIANRIYSILQFRRVRSNTGAYLLSQAGAKKLSALQPAIFPIDQHLKRRWLTHLASYCVTPIIPQSQHITSTIDVMAEETKTPSRVKAGLFAHIGFYLKHYPLFIRYHLKRIMQGISH